MLLLERSGGIACGGRKGTGEGICCSCVFLVSLWHARSRRILRDREPQQSSGLPAEAHDASILVHMAAALSVTALPFGTRGLQSWAFRPFCHRCFFLSFSSSVFLHGRHPILYWSQHLRQELGLAQGLPGRQDHVHPGGGAPRPMATLCSVTSLSRSLSRSPSPRYSMKRKRQNNTTRGSSSLLHLEREQAICFSVIRTVSQQPNRQLPPGVNPK